VAILAAGLLIVGSSNGIPARATARNTSLATAADTHGVAKFYFDSRTKLDGRSYLYSIDADGSHLRRVGPLGSQDPSLSLDGRRLAYEFQATDDFLGPRHLVVANIDGSGAHAITPTKSELAYTPAWSPDGRRILYGHGGGGPGTGVYVINADGRHRVRVPHTDEGTNPAWYPNGRRLAYVVGLDPCCKAYSINLDGRSKVPIRGPSSIHGMDVSPDGRKVAFSAAAPNSTTKHYRSQIVVQDVVTGRVLQLTSTAGCALNPRWSPDGAVIFYPKCQRDSQDRAALGKSTLMSIRPESGAKPTAVFPRQLDLFGLAILRTPPTVTPKPGASGSASPPTSSTGAPSQTTSTASEDSSSRTVPVAIAAVLLGLLAAAIGAMYRRLRTR
jgi:Tol biopolymer transport system component